MTTRTPTDWPQQAGILCNDEAFRRWLAEERLFHGDPKMTHATPDVAAEYLRRFCHIQSRRDLATNIDARARFRILRTEFDAWSGRIASQR